MKLISVCIPTYEMHGRGATFLRESFEILKSQTFTDFDVVISDGSKDDSIKKLCQEYTGILDITYHPHPTSTGASSNINNAIKHATGTIIKILLQDDYLYNEHSLADIAAHFDLQKTTWLATPCIHSSESGSFFKPFYPRFNTKLVLGKNTIGAPSVIAIKNQNPLMFDENLHWLLDCDYYERYFEAFGIPTITKEIGVVIRTGDHQLTNTVATRELRKKEYFYILKKYYAGIPYLYYALAYYAHYPLRCLKNFYERNK